MTTFAKSIDRTEAPVNHNPDESGRTEKRVLVIRPGALGDIILTLPAIQAIVRSGKSVGVEILGNLPVTQWLVGRSAVGVVRSFDGRDIAALFGEEGDLPDSLTRYLSGFELVLNYTVGEDSALSRNLKRLCRRVLELDVRPRALPAMHMADYLQRPLSRLGIVATEEPPRISLLPQDRAAANVWLQARGAQPGRLIAVHAGSGSRDKNWPPERFAQVIRANATDSEASVVVVRGPADDLAADEVARATSGVNVLWLKQPSLPLLAALLQVCQVYVGNDSGVSHLAAAIGTPSVVLFGPTDPTVWAPRGPAVHIVRGYAECSPCTSERRRSCPVHRCLEAIAVERVLTEMVRASSR